MRGPEKFPVYPDLLALLAVIALVTVVYLLSLPQKMNTLADRKADAAVPFSLACEAVDQEETLLSDLAIAADTPSWNRLRQALLKNERHFHDAMADAANRMPEAKGELAELADSFDELLDNDDEWLSQAEYARALKPMQKRCRDLQARFRPQTPFAK